MVRSKWKDRLMFPLLVFLSEKRSRELGLTPLTRERLLITLEHCRGKVLDIGCGCNELVRQYGNGVGVDIYPWEKCDLVAEDTAHLPFSDAEFDTVTMIAVLNHITNREEVLREAHRLLKKDGLLLITMLNPVIGYICHKIRYKFDPDQLERGMAREEKYGLWGSEINALLSKTGFKLKAVQPFVFWLNNLYIAEKI